MTEARPLRGRLLAALQHRIVHDIGLLAAGSAAVQGALLVATPFILSIYGASTFGMYSVVFVTSSLIGSSVRLEDVISVLDRRHQSLRLVSASLMIYGSAALAGYIVVGLLVMGFGPSARWMGDARWHYLSWIPAVAFTQALLAICRAFMVRSKAFKLSVLFNLTRASTFITLAIGLGLALPATIAAVHLILFSQVAGDLSAIALFLVKMRRRERRLVLPWPPARPIAGLRRHKRLIAAASFAGLLSEISFNIPAWTIPSVYGLTQTGWFSASQRMVTAPIVFVANTVNVAFNQHAREKRSRGEPLGRDIARVTGILFVLLSPVFIAMGVLTQSSWLGYLGSDWAQAGPTIAAMLLMAVGFVFYVAVENLPLVFQLKRILVGYQVVRLGVTALVGLSAFVFHIEYGTWIYCYALSQMALIGGNALVIMLSVRKAEAAASRGNQRSLGNA